MLILDAETHISWRLCPRGYEAAYMTMNRKLSDKHSIFRKGIKWWISSNWNLIWDDRYVVNHHVILRECRLTTKHRRNTDNANLTVIVRMLQFRSSSILDRKWGRKTLFAEVTFEYPLLMSRGGKPSTSLPDGRWRSDRPKRESK